MTRRLINATFALERLAEGDEDRDEYGVAMLVADGTYNGIFVPAKELKKAAASMEAQPLNIDHSFRVEDEVGFVRNVQFVKGVLRGILVLNPATAKYTAAKAYIKNRQAAGKVPEVSVGFYCDIDEDEELGLVAKNIGFDHLALVTRGACSPEDGAGIGLARTQEVPTMAKDNEVPPPAGAGAGAPVAPTALKADHDKQVADLQAELAQVRQEKADVEQELRVYQSKEFADLKSEAVALGAPVAETDDIASLRSKVEVAKAVLAKAPKQPEPAQATRHTRPNVEQAPTGAGRARSLAARVGLSLDD